MEDQKQTNAIQVLEEEALTVPEKAKIIQISDEGTLIEANEILKVVKTLRKEIKSVFSPIIDKAHSTWKEALAQKKKVEQPLVEAEDFLKPQIASYQREQEEARRAEQQRIEKELEEKRQEAERLRKEAEEAEKDWDEKEAVVKKEKAEALAEETKELTEDLIAAPGPTKLEGTGIRQDWKWELECIKDVPRVWLKLDEVAINAHVRQMKQDSSIPGIRVFPVDVVITRTE